MIEVKNLVKQYGNKKAIDNISFTAEKGEILGLLGPNGAGKSTTMNIITGYISSNAGTVTIDGSEILKDPIGAKSKIGYLPEIPPLYLDMTVKSYLSFIYDLKKVKADNKSDHIWKICELVKIDDIYNRIIKNLSKGYKQRVGLAQALLGKPPLLILDEPTVGLDPKQIIEIRNLIKEISSEHTIILSSHILSEIEAVCDRVVVINNGKIIANDKTENLSNNISKIDTYTAVIEGNKDDIYKALTLIEGIIDIKVNCEKENNSSEYTIQSKSDSNINRDVFKALAEIDCPLLSITKVSANLEDVFLKLTSEENDLEANTDENLGNDLPAEETSLDTEQAVEDNTETQTNNKNENGGDCE